MGPAPVETPAGAEQRTRDLQPEKKLTRQQRRFIERIEIEAKQTLAALSDKFVDYFMESDDPEGKDVIAKLDQLAAQWKAYCSWKRLNESAKDLLEKDCQHFIQIYLTSKKETVQPVEPGQSV